MLLFYRTLAPGAVARQGADGIQQVHEGAGGIGQGAFAVEDVA